MTGKSMKHHAILMVMAAGLLTGCQTLGGTGAKTELANIKPVPPSVTASAGISGGGLVGGPFGVSLATADKQTALDAEYKALEYGNGGEEIVWTGAKPQVSGKVKASQPYRVGSQDCRQYSHELSVAGIMTVAKATACRNGDGSWTMLE